MKVSSNKRQNPTNCEVSSLGLAWKSSFRTYDWASAVGDVETTISEI